MIFAAAAPVNCNETIDSGTQITYTYYIKLSLWRAWDKNLR